MRVFHIVSSVDAQSIPLELALHLDLPETDIRIAAFTASDEHELGRDDPRVLQMNAKGPLDFDAAKRLREAIKSFDPDIVHVHHAASSLWGTWSARITRRAHKGPRRLVFKTEHNDRSHQTLKNTVINLLTYPLLDGVICNSEATHASLKSHEHRILGDKAWSIHNGVDTARVAAGAASREEMRSSLGLTPDIFCIGTVGRFVEQKNFERLIEGFAKAHQQVVGKIVLVLVGSGPLEFRLRTKAAELNVSDSVLFTGGKSRDEVYQHLGAFDGFVMPSMWEGFCNAAVEAMAAGLPLAASDLPVLQEVLGETSMFFDPKSPSSISEALLALANLPSDVRNHQRSVNQTVAKRYDIEKAAAKYLNLYKALLQAQSPEKKAPE